MVFPHGISRESLARWLAFETISRVQAKRGASVGSAAMRLIVDRELEAILRATVAFEQREARPSPPSKLARSG